LRGSTSKKKRGLKMEYKPVKVKDENTGRTWYAIFWKGLEYRFSTYQEAFQFYAALRYEMLYGVLKPEVSFLD
jgi:hypothetical protein